MKGKSLFIKGVARRKKEVRRMRIMTCIAVFFLVFTLLLQDNLNAFQKEMNDRKYGSWVVRSTRSLKNNSDLELGGYAKVGSYIYLTHPISSDNNDFPLVRQADGSNKQPPIKDEDGNWLPPEKKIKVANQGAMRNTMYRIGAFTEDFKSNYDIGFYEGRWPEKDDEIVMERDVLLRLGASYDLGQKLTFYLAKPFKENTADDDMFINPDTGLAEPEWNIRLELYTFTLVGTIEKYTNRWSQASYTLPNAVISEKAYRSILMNNKDYGFYELAPELKKNDPWNAAAAVFERYKSDDPANSPFALNRLNYDNPFWGSAAVFTGMTVLLMLLSACMLAYLMAAYLGKRRRFFLRMREIGASAGEVWRMAAYECLGAVIPSALVTLAVSLLLSIGAVFLISRMSRIGFFFIMKPVRALEIVLVLAGVIAASLIAAILVFAGRSLAEKKKPMSRGAVRSLRRKALRCGKNAYLGWGETVKRESRINRGKTLLFKAVIILFAAVIMLCSNRVFVPLYYWLKAAADVDLIAECLTFPPGIVCTVDTLPHLRRGALQKLYTYDMISVDFGGNCYYMQDLMPEAVIEDLKLLSGVRAVYADTLDPKHHLEWEGWKETPFMSACIEAGIHWPDYTKLYKVIYEGNRLEDFRTSMGASFFRLFCLGNTDKVWKDGRKYLGSEADKEAFIRGEQVIVLVDENASYLRSAYENAKYPELGEPLESYLPDGNVWKQLGAAFKAGDEVSVAKTLTTYDKHPASVPVTIAAVAPMEGFPLKTGCYEDEIDQAMFTIIGSPELARRMMETEGLEYGANTIGVDFDVLGVNDNSIKSAIRIYSAYGVQLIWDNTEWAEMSRRDFRDKVSTYGVVGAAMTVLFVFLVSTVSEDERNRRRKKLDAMRSIGASKKRLMRSQGLAAAKQSLWLLLALPASYLMSVVSYASRGAFKGLLHDKEKLIALLKFLAKPLEVARKVIESYEFNLPTALPTLAVLMLVYWLIARKLDFAKDENERTA